MKTYYVTYKTNTDGDISTVWCEAESPQDAASQVRDDYWDCDEIISVRTKP